MCNNLKFSGFHYWATREQELAS